MHLCKLGRLKKKGFTIINYWVLFFVMTVLVAPTWAGSTGDKTDEKLLFKPLYYDQATGLGVIQDTKGIAIGIKDALFRIHIKENGEHKIFCIEIYPENLPITGTHIDELPVDIINMLLETYPKYNLM
jgi:hypothetical protein